MWNWSVIKVREEYKLTFGETAFVAIYDADD